MKRDRIALFGGSFNPPHVGHLQIALAAGAQFELDEVRFIPANISPFKQTPSAEDAMHRLAMASLLVQDQESFSVWDTEFDRGGISYTADTIRAFRNSEPDKDWFLLIGSDAYSLLDRWKESAYIRDNSNVIVYPRLGDEFSASPGATLLEGEYLDVSSTDIRTMIAAGESIGDLVSAPVAAYISEFELYG